MAQSQAGDTLFPATAPNWAHAMFNLLTEVNKKFDALALRMDRVEERVNQLGAEMHTFYAERTALVNALALKDSCEIRFTGIPAPLLADPEKMTSAARDVLSAIGCIAAHSTILQVRPWNPKQTSSEVGNRSGYRSGIVTRFSLNDIRDFVAASTAKLKDLNA